MIENATGIVLRIRPLTETSLIVHWLTAKLGRVATVAKGGRGAKSPFRGKLDLFYLADFSFSRSRRSELHALREVSLQATHSELRHDLARLRQAAYGTTFIEQATETEAPVPELYALMLNYVTHLTHYEAKPQWVFSFELKMLALLGMAPDFMATRLTGGTLQLAQLLQDGNWEMITRLKISEAQTNELHRFLHGFLIYHLEKIPKGRQIAIGLQER